MSDETKVKIERDQNLADLYANNTRFETSVWDLKLLFGKLDLSQTPPEIVRLHTSITMPWPTAKIMAYFMAINVIIHQQEQGVIPIPERVMPPRPDPDNPELSAFHRDTILYMRWVHDQFFGPEPYVPPGMGGSVS